MSEPNMSYVNEAYVNPRVQRTVTNLDDFSDVTLVKVGTFSPVKSYQEAVERLANNHDKLIQVINDGLRAELLRSLRTAPDGWHTLTEDGEMNGEFNGTPADPKAINQTVLTLAKTVFEYGAVDSPEHRRASKEKAKEFIKNTPTIREGLKKSAALRDED